MTIQIEIGTIEQYQKIVGFLNHIKMPFIKKEDKNIQSPFDMAAYRRQISEVSVWTDADIAYLEEPSQNFNWSAPEW